MIQNARRFGGPLINIVRTPSSQVLFGELIPMLKTLSGELYCQFQCSVRLSCYGKSGLLHFGSCMFMSCLLSLICAFVLLYARFSKLDNPKWETFSAQKRRAPGHD